MPPLRTKWFLWEMCKSVLDYLWMKEMRLHTEEHRYLPHWPASPWGKVSKLLVNCSIPEVLGSESALKEAFATGQSASARESKGFVEGILGWLRKDQTQGQSIGG